MRPDRLMVNGHQLYVEQHGQVDSPAVVLLHHGLGAVQAWEAQIAAMVQAGYYVVVYDRWGYGRSEGRVEFSMPAFEDDLADLHRILAYYGLSKVTLVGHSDGGTIALYYAASHPQQVERLVVIAAHIYIEPKMVAGIDGMRQNFEQNERFRAGLSRLHGEKVDQVVHGWYAGWCREAVLDWDMRPALAQVACPVLVVQGEDDEHATPQHARDLAAALPQAALWLEPGAGHMLPQQYAEAFNSRLLAFLNS